MRARGDGARRAGGTCVNVGCVPKKAMWLAADLAERGALAEALGFGRAALPADWDKLLARRAAYIERIHGSYRKRLAKAGVVLVPQYARLLDAHTVQAADGGRFSAAHAARHRRAAVAAGHSRGRCGVGVRRFLRARSRARRVALVGGGYIAVELAGVLHALGSHVETFVRGDALLSGFDAELAAQLRGRAAGHRRAFRPSPRGDPADGTQRWLRDADGKESGPFDAVFLATGRAPNTGGFGLDAVGVALDAKGHVIVDAWQDTSVPGIHAVGDVTARPALTPVAIAAARRLMDRVFGGRAGARLDYADIPSVVFSHPPLGKVGLTEAEARAAWRRRADIPHELRADAGIAGRQRPAQPVQGGVHGRGTGVLGIHLLGDGADEILQGFAVALKRGITLQDLQDSVPIHPTSAEEVVLVGG
jgi:glutathione reductase (NADPH)